MIGSIIINLTLKLSISDLDSILQKLQRTSFKKHTIVTLDLIQKRIVCHIFCRKKITTKKSRRKNY